MKVKALALALLLGVGSVAYAQTNRGLVASATPESTKAGALILSKGGNAVDAAVATAFTLGVTEPAMSGIGGRTMIILSVPNQEPIAIGGHSVAPKVLDKDISKEELTYYKQVSIPSQVKILHYVWKKYGSGNIKWKDLLAPAIEYANNGFVVGQHRHHVFRRLQDKLKNSHFHNNELLIDGNIPAIVDTIKQPTLANTLQRLATAGARDFYEGGIAREIAEDFKHNNGWITYDDLATFPEPQEHSALHVTYRGYDVYSFVPPGGGWQVLQALKILEQYDQEDINKYSNERTKRVADALNMSHNDRLENSITDYKDYQEEVDEKISNDYAKKLHSSFIKSSSTGKEIKDNGQGETTHFSIVDEDGLAVSVTSSIGAYLGSLASTKSLGFFYNSYMKSLMGFGLGKSLESSVNIPSSMSPSLVKKDGQNVLVIGTPGSKRIVSTISQLIQLWIDGDESIQDIIKFPRVHAIQNSVYLEDEQIDVALLHALRLDGYTIAFPQYDLTNNGLNAYFGGVHAIEFKNGTWKAAADPRRDGQATTIIINK